jgi:peroxiredoxin
LNFNLEKVMTRIFLIIVFVLTWVIAHGQEQRNVIRGEIEGLEIGNRVILSIKSPDGKTWIATDSTVADKAGEFTLATRVTGNLVVLKFLKTGEALDASNTPECSVFLEGYAELRVTGSMKEWFFMKTSGGVYAHPDMRGIVSASDSSRAVQKEMLALSNRARETGDARLQEKSFELRKQVMIMSRDRHVLEAEFREKHPEMAYSALLLLYDSGWSKDIDKYEEAFHALAPGVQDSPAGQLVRNQIASARSAEVGAIAPDFTLADMNGDEITLSAYRGKHVLVDFWGSWCAPCRQSSPEMVKLYAALRDKGASVEFIGVACDDRDDKKWLKAIEEDNLTWIQLNDTHSEKSKSIQQQYHILSVPVSFLISPTGKILYKEHPVDIIPKIKELFGL